MILGDTIAAIATAPGRGGVAIVRVSGSESFGIAEKITSAADLTANRLSAQHALFYEGSPERRTNRTDDRVIDDGIVLAFKGPHSYTGEDVIEFQCHGGAVTPRRVLEACLVAGARLARRGEFTERAFLNGRIGYEQAAAVLDLIDAKTARAADAALESLAGRRKQAYRALYERALDLSVQIEHVLDIDEGELPGDCVAELKTKSQKLKGDLERAIQKANEGKLLREGARVVLAGPPNVGKSSLLNALLEENRAIVSDAPGTTRDAIEAWIDLDGWPIRLVDTAGLRATGDQVEGEGVKRAEDLMAKADVIVLLGSCDVEKLRTGSWSLNLSTSQLLNITSKCDLGRGEGLNVSAKTGEGLEDLKRAIVACLERKVAAADEGDSSAVDCAALHEALASLNRTGGGLARKGARREEDLVLLANAVRSAAERLGSAIGATYSSDLLDNLFSRFCVGK